MVYEEDGKNKNEIKEIARGFSTFGLPQFGKRKIKNCKNAPWVITNTKYA